MKKSPKRIAVLAALFLLANSLNILTAKAEELQEAPAFHAYIEYSSQGYVAKGSFTQIPPDISLIQPLYSLNGETYQACGEPWDLHLPGMDDADAQAKLQNQICLYPSQEPLKSYLDMKLERFYLKLRLVLKNGTTYETQAALIDRGSPLPIPKELHPDAQFAPSLAAYETRPFCGYGKYQLTVCVEASPWEIASCLPDTLPVEIQLSKDLRFITSGIVDCPVTWKPLSLSRLTAGESLTIHEAAEEIVIPKGALLNTPTGIFRLNEPLKLYDQYGMTDEVRLVLNAVSKNEEPTGVLKEEHGGLEMAFHLKPTGATAIQAYVWSENSPTWTSLSGLSLLDAVNAQPSTASSGYALVIGRDQEPYRSYLAEKAAGNSPTPFLIGLTIEGGIYDGRQLILAWPDTYEPPLALPKLDGSGGNEANAGSDNKNDSTPEGQRPNLPQDSEGSHDAKESSESFPQENRQEQNNMSRNPVSYIQYPVATQLPANAPAEQKTPAKTAATDTKNNSHTETAADTENDPPTETTAREPRSAKPTASAPASSGQNENMDTGKTSGLPEMPNRGTADESRRTFPPLAAAAAAGIGIGIAAAARKITAGKKSGRTLSILQKLHHKCRTLARR